MDKQIPVNNLVIVAGVFGVLLLGMLFLQVVQPAGKQSPVATVPPAEKRAAQAGPPAAARDPQERAVTQWAEAEKSLQQYFREKADDNEIDFNSDIKKVESLTAPYEAFLMVTTNTNPAQPKYSWDKLVFKWKNGRWVHNSAYFTEVQNWQRSRVDPEQNKLLTEISFGGKFASPASRKLQAFLQEKGLWE